MKLTTEQEETVYNTVVSAGLRIDTLRDNIVDHLCCVIESQIGKKDKTFDTLLLEAIEDLAPHGLKQLENQTIFLLNSNRIIIMKKLMYTTGFIGAFTITVGTMFKLLHYPMANVLFGIGFTVLLLIFFPLLGLDRYKVAIAKSLTEKTKIILGITSAIIVGISGVFKIMHLMGANVLLVIGVFIFAFGFLPMLFFTMYKKSVS